MSEYPIVPCDKCKDATTLEQHLDHMSREEWQETAYRAVEHQKRTAPLPTPAHTDAKTISDLRARLLRQADTIEKFQVKGRKTRNKIEKLKARLASMESGLLAVVDNLKVENRDLSGALDLARAVSERRMGRTHELEREIARLAEALAQVDGLAATRLSKIHELDQTIEDLRGQLAMAKDR